jgi:hypothetical protein
MRILQKKVIAKSPRRHNGFAAPKDPWDFYFFTRVFLAIIHKRGLAKFGYRLGRGSRNFLDSPPLLWRQGGL